MSQQSMNHWRRERSTRSKVWGKGAEKSRLARLIRNGAACVCVSSLVVRSVCSCAPVTACLCVSVLAKSRTESVRLLMLRPDSHFISVASFMSLLHSFSLHALPFPVERPSLPFLLRLLLLLLLLLHLPSTMISEEPDEKRGTLLIASLRCCQRRRRRTS